MNIDTSVFLSEFEAEARIHIEKIETAFLDISMFASDLKLINSVFRAAHSMKGTAGFLSLGKVVAVTHELENILSQVKEGFLAINEEIADIVLQSVDCLKELIDNLNNDDDISVIKIVETLKKYAANTGSLTVSVAANAAANAASSRFSDVTPGDAPVEDVHIPFNLSDNHTEKTLKNALKRGHKIYFVNIDFNRSLGKYYKNPRGMIEDIFSIGLIVQVIVDNSVTVGSVITSNVTAGSVTVNNTEKKLVNTDNNIFIDDLVNALKENDTSTLKILVTSVLEIDLFSKAVGVDSKHIFLLSRKIIFGEESEADITAASEEYNNKNILQKKLAEKDKNNKSSKENNMSIRLNITDINKIMDLANEMILTRNQLFSIAADHKKSIPGFTPLLHDINHLTTEIHERIMFTRMQPISVIFNKFPRIIRDTAKTLKKDITVNILRDDITLDKYLLEELTDPITQLVKNSADHGMESAQQRAATGKPPKGTITLDAYMRDGSAIIEVIDDGRGIDIDALKNKAVERGIVTEEILASMPKGEVFNLIFKPGISTARNVTNLSGRGVGMDIVKTNIEKSGGSIEVESGLGAGTTVRLKMPLTLSVINTLIVNIDYISYAVPELNVEHIVRICSNNASTRIEKVNKSLVLIYNGLIIPIITMKEIEAKAKGASGSNTSLVSADKVLERCLAANVTKCLILRADGRRFALLIDDALDTEQVLVKPLPIYLQNCPCYFGVTVLGSGKAVTILDAAGIMRFMGIENIERDVSQQFSLAPEKYRKTLNEKQILIFMCSGKEYFAVDLGDISRIEVIKAKDIQEINDESFINIAGITWRIARPENFAPVEKLDYTEEKLYFLILKNTLHMGLLVKKVIDKTEDEFVLDNKQIYSDFIFGTGVYNEKILIFLNPAAIAEHIENEKVSNRNIRQEKIP